jgi:hypothetical protein
MPGFNNQQLAYNVRSGNQVVLLIGDQAIAFCQTVTHTFDLGAEGLYGVGTAKPQEIQQLRVAPQITVDSFALTDLGQSILSNGTNLASLLANNKFNLCVVDGTTDTALYTYVGGVASNFSETVATNRPITDAVTFLCMDVLDQTGLSILNGPNALTINANLGAAGVGNLGVTLTAGL